MAIKNKSVHSRRVMLVLSASYRLLRISAGKRLDMVAARTRRHGLRRMARRTPLDVWVDAMRARGRV